jgi:glucose/arabinose dehydrogenase
MQNPLAHVTSPLLVLLLSLLGGCFGPSLAAETTLEVVAEGFVQPLGIVNAGDGSERLFIIEQRGTVQSLHPDGRVTLWLDLRDRTRARGERGLLGLAFHPDFARNGRVFTHYTDPSGTTVLSEWRVETLGAPVSGDEVVLYTLPQPYANHNGGDLHFGPDGMLYLAMGDGGSSGDPLNAGQDLSTPLGALLRFDVDTLGPGQLAIPASNPFLNTPGAAPEIWAYGLRNPWRFHFDVQSGDLWIADVGQNAVEEVNWQSAASAGGENYGWRVAEGDRCFNPRTGCDTSGFTAPVISYQHTSGWGRSITGGVVPYGDAAPSLRGRYLFADFVSGRLFVTQGDPRGDISSSELLATGFPIATFGLDERHDAYLADYAGGVVYRLVEGR